MQYVGEVFSIDSEIGQERLQRYKHSTCTYLMSTSNNEVIDPTFVGNIARFINHSCEPNCETQKWNVLGEVCVGIFALNDIYENEELTFDYQFDFFKTPFTKCYCGANKCKGYLGVLATSSNGSLLQKDQAPYCSYCNKIITEKFQILVCKGPCKGTFHQPCVMIREGKSRPTSIEKKLFVCKECEATAKRISRQKSENMSNLAGQILGASESGSGNFQVDAAMVEELPWESTNPEVRRYYEDSEDNNLLDSLILQEAEQVKKDLETNGKKYNQGQFSEFYNFTFLLTKRLKMRIKQDKSNHAYKFRKSLEICKQHKQNKLNSKKIAKEFGIEQKKLLKQRNFNKQSIDVVGAINSDQSTVEGGAVKMMRVVIKRPEIIQGDLTKKKRGRKPKAQPLLQVQDSQKSNATQLQDIPERQSQFEDDEEMKESFSKEHKHQSTTLTRKRELKRLTKNLPESGEEDSDNKMKESDEENEDDFIDDEEIVGEVDTEQEEEEVDMENEESESELVDDDEEDEEEGESSSNEYADATSEKESNDDDLNLEELQSEEEEKEKEKKQDYSIITDQSGEDLNTSRRRHRQISFALDESSKKPSQAMIKQSPFKNQYHMQSLELSTKEKSQQISILIKQSLDHFIQNQTSEHYSDVKESKVNIYEPVFNKVIIDHNDDFEIIPQLQLYWDAPWGGMITVKIVSTLKVYTFITTVLQDVTSKMQELGLLVNMRYFERLQYPNFQNEAFQKQLSQLYPFEILVLNVPKNFLRKIVGYQEKLLTIYKKNHTVDFDFNRDLLVDEVFQMNETTPLRIIGRNSDVVIVNEIIQRQMSFIQMKTLLFQSCDCKIIMDNVKEIKTKVDPCEMRVRKSAREWKDLKHPFFYVPNYLREVLFIGTKDEIASAEKKLEAFLNFNRPENYKNGTQQLSFLLPLSYKSQMPDIKKNLVQKFNDQIQFFYYEPTFPRKHLTILFIGPWKLIANAKKYLEEKVNTTMDRVTRSFENFQQFTFHQQIRFSFKSLKRFILEADVKYLNHWDICSLFIENAGKVSTEEEKSCSQESVANNTQSNKLPETSLLSKLIAQERESPLQNESNLWKLVQPTSSQSSTQPPQQTVLSNTLTRKQIQQQEELAQQEQSAQYFIKRNQSDYRALVQYLKDDVETCMNSLFVLSKSEDTLESLMKRLRVSKSELITMMAQVLQENIKDFQYKSQSDRYYPKQTSSYQGSTYNQSTYRSGLSPQHSNSYGQSYYYQKPLGPPQQSHSYLSNRYSSSSSYMHNQHESRNVHSNNQIHEPVPLIIQPHKQPIPYRTTIQPTPISHSFNSSITASQIIPPILQATMPQSYSSQPQPIIANNTISVQVINPHFQSQTFTAPPQFTNIPSNKPSSDKTQVEHIHHHHHHHYKKTNKRSRSRSRSFSKNRHESRASSKSSYRSSSYNKNRKHKKSKTSRQPRKHHRRSYNNESRSKSFQSESDNEETHKAKQEIVKKYKHHPYFKKSLKERRSDKLVNLFQNRRKTKGGFTSSDPQEGKSQAHKNQSSKIQKSSNKSDKKVESEEEQPIGSDWGNQNKEDGQIY